MLIALALSVVMGVALGLFGGGGSILTVPILLYAVDLGAREAIATSLVVVGATSAIAAIAHARAGNVAWRTAGLFGTAAMVGAYGGGVVAQFIPETVLLVVFGALMAATGIAMLRGFRASKPTRSEPAVLAAIAEGLIVGSVTGLVGAGGGFLVVPALVLLGGLDMRRAVGTSLVVVAMKSFAGFAGYASHVSVDLTLSGSLIAAAIVGSIAGAALVKRMQPERLRRAFAWFVFAMAAFVLAQQLPAAVYQAVFVDRWPFWAGGAAIGAFVLVFLIVTGRALGVSTGYSDACGAATDPGLRSSWRLPFIVGIVGGGLLSALASGSLSPSAEVGLFDALVTASLPVKAMLFFVGGILLGFGARLAGGCTSGHGIVGMSLTAPSSLIATGAFMVSGFAVTNLVLRVIGGSL